MNSAARAPNAPLVAAFLMGGLFFSVLLPGFIQGGNKLFEPLRRRRAEIKQAKGNKAKKHRAGRIEFQTVQKPALVVFQHISKKLVQLSFQTQLQRGLLDSLEKVENSSIRQIELNSFRTISPPKFRKGRIYENIENAMIFDVDVSWKNALEGQLEITTKQLGLLVPVDVRNVNIDGTVRIVLTPLHEEPPGFGAILVSFVRTPRLDLDVDIVGKQITNVPWLREALIVAIQRTLENEMVWPNRLVNPSLVPNFNETMLEADELEQLATKDPFLVAENVLLDQRKEEGGGRRGIKRSPRATPNTTKGTSSEETSSETSFEGFKNTTSWKHLAPLKIVQSWWNRAAKQTRVAASKGKVSDRPTAKKDLDMDQAVDWDKLVAGLLKPFDSENEDVSSSTNTTTNNVSSTPLTLESLQSAIQEKATNATEKLSQCNSIEEFISLFDDDEAEKKESVEVR